jgi:hypothetical protein
MRRLPHVTTLLLIMMTLCSRPAQAQDWWDFFAELSGPGPFQSRGNATLTVYCRHADFAADASQGKTGSSRGGNDRWFHLLQDPTAKGPCIFLDVRTFRTRKGEDDRRWFPVRMEVYESGATYRLWERVPLEIGAGAGVIHFDSSGVIANRAIVDVPRVSLKPLLLIPALRKTRNGGFGFLQAYYRASFILGNLNQNDFRPKPQTTFNTDNDLVPSAGFLIDPIALARLIANR